MRIHLIKRLFLTMNAVLFVLLWCLSAEAACTSPCVQIKNNAASGAQSSINFTFDSSQTSGNTNVISLTFCTDGGCGTDATTTVISVTDTAGTTYTPIIDNKGNANIRVVTLTGTVAATGSNTVTVTLSGGSGSPNFLGALGSEWSGFSASPFDASGKDNNSTQDPSVSTTGSTSQAAEVVYGFVVNFGALATVGSGYSELNTSAVALTLSDEYKTVSSTGTQTATWTHDAATWIANVATFKEAGGGGPVCRPGSMLLMGVGC